MSEFLGGFKNLKNILQIPLTGWFYPDYGPQSFGRYADVWSAADREYLTVNANSGGVECTGIPAYGRGVRLLDA